MHLRSLLAHPGVATSILLAATAGAFDALGQIGYVQAAARGHMGVAAALVGVCPAITVLLAVLMLGERLTRTQFAGFALEIAGILFIAE